MSAKKKAEFDRDAAVAEACSNLKAFHLYVTPEAFNGCQTELEVARRRRKLLDEHLERYL